MPEHTSEATHNTLVFLSKEGNVAGKDSGI
jgi:hypothetical protein